VIGIITKFFIYIKKRKSYVFTNQIKISECQVIYIKITPKKYLNQNQSTVLL